VSAQQTSDEPHWTRYDASVRPRALILMLHGGKERGQQVVDGRSLSWRRSASMQREIARRAHQAGASVWLLRFTARGWNGGPPRIADARSALDDVRRELGDVPVCLLGHSMGARAAIHVADDPQVRGVVALAPWFPPGEGIGALRDKQLYAAHGSRDRITSARATQAYVRRAAEVARTAAFRDMGPLGHYLLRGRREWNRVALELTLQVLA
jgi:pimeloyl-ACP methyl ester carboxylesterase